MSRGAELRPSERAPGLLLGDGVDLPDDVELGGHVVVHAGSLMVHAVSGPDSPRLTRRELEIVRLLARGLTNREIGRVALISDSTVKFHVRGIMRKLAVHHRAEVVYAASKLGLL